MNRSEVLEGFAELPFSVEAELGNLSLAIGEILALQEGAILQTDHPVGAPFKMRVGGAEIGLAEAIVVGDRLAMRIQTLKRSAGSAEANGTN